MIFSPIELHTTPVNRGIIFLSLLCFSIGFLYAQYSVKIKPVMISLPGLPLELEGLKIIQLTDLHVGPTIRKSYVEKVVLLANSAKPDLVVLTGDLVDGMVKDLSQEIDPIKKMQANFGKFSVPGNHEFYWEGPQWIEKIKQLGFTALINSHQLLEIHGRKIAIAGVPDPAAAMAKMEGPDFVKAAAGIPADTFLKIVLCHQPKFAPLAQAAGFDLQLSGHTHGGQFFPWTLIARWVHSFHSGLYIIEKLRLYVSKGTGYWGPPVRLGAPSEITLITLKA